jgi:hypothetical protein
MSKCHVRELLNVYEHLLKDASYTFPTLVTEFERDLARLLVHVEQRGFSALAVDLPAVGKHLDRCLSGGQYKLSGLPLTKRFSGRTVIPKLFRGLYLLVFHTDGLLREDYSSDAILFLRQLCYVGKKARVSCSLDKVEDEVLKLVETDKALPEPEKFWLVSDPSLFDEPHPYVGIHKSALIRERLDQVSDRSMVANVSSFLTTLDAVSRVVTCALRAYHPEQWRFRHGPGAIAEVAGPSNKYYWTGWSNLLDSEYPLADYGFHSHNAWADRCNDLEEFHWQRPASPISESEPLSRLVAVPKSFTAPRLIAAEPCANQWCQQNIWHYFEAKTKASWISKFVRFRDQTYNQDLCLKGSRDGSLATLDLSEASDRVTCHVVGQFFRSNPKLLRCLRATRTRGVSQRLTHKAPSVISLRKFSTMGSACTFPVETLVFLGIALSAVLSQRRLKPTRRNIRSLEGEVAIFGDDIVIPVDSRELFVASLEVLYFKVNTKKSFWTGKFRESCGVDSFDGNTVTPVYWKEYYSGKPESLASVVECANNFYKKSLLHTANYLASTVPRDIPRVAMGSGVFGLKTRCRPDLSMFKHRYNQHLQRVEIRVRSIISTQTKSPTDDDTALMQFFTELPSPFVEWTHGVAQRPLTRTSHRWVPLDELLA